MNRKNMVVANVQYKKPTSDDAKRHKGLLRYLTYRDGRYGHIKQKAGVERWVDHGLGNAVGEIAQRCDDYRSDHVLVFNLVFNPNPELMAMVPFAQRETFVKQLTETTLNQFFEARGVESGIEYSYVLHHRESKNKESPGLHDPHTHIVLPGTYYDEAKGERVPLFFGRNKQVNHIDLLHRLSQDNMGVLMEHYAGKDWEQRYDALEAVRDEERRVVEGEPHGGMVDEQGRVWDTWIGTRCTDSERTAIGYYRHYPINAKSQATEFEPDDLALEFSPLTFGLTHAQAHQLTEFMIRTARDDEQDLDVIVGLAQDVDGMDKEERERFFGGAPSHYPEPDMGRESRSTSEVDLDFF